MAPEIRIVPGKQGSTFRLEVVVDGEVIATKESNHTSAMLTGLDKHLLAFLEAMGVQGYDQRSVRGLIVAHGDKGYSFRLMWQDHGVPFAQGMAVYLLSYCPPYESQVRETKQGWVAPGPWVIEMYHKYRHLLPDLENQ